MSLFSAKMINAIRCAETKSMPFTTLQTRTVTSVKATKRIDGYIRLQYLCTYIS